MLERELVQLHQKIEPGSYGRMFTGSFYGFMEYALYALVVLVLVFCFWFDANWAVQKEGVAVEDLSAEVLRTLTQLNFVIRILGVAFAVACLLVARVFRSMRKMLFKLAEVPETLERLQRG